MAIYRQCPVCRTSVEKREIPDKFKTLGVDVPYWYFYECMNCGTLMLVQPYSQVKLVAKG